MNNIVMQLKMEKSRFERNLSEVKIKISRLLNELAQLSCPYFSDIKEINAVEIEQIGDELLEVKNKAIEIQDKLDKIKKDLGENV